MLRFNATELHNPVDKTEVLPGLELLLDKLRRDA